MGLDLKRLGFYLEENNITQLKLRYAGFANPNYRGIYYEELNCTPTDGYIVISALRDFIS